MLIAAGILSLLIWAYLLLARGQFWRIRIVNQSPVENALPVRIAVIVPARDEAGVVGRAIHSLLQQTGAHLLHIFLVDDGSSDGTAQAPRSIAAAAGKQGRAAGMEGQALTPGWAGKMWALHQGVSRARDFRPDFFLFTDADVVHAPDGLSQLLAISRLGPYDLVSFLVKLHCETPVEKLLIPAFVFFFFKLYPPAWVADPQRSTAAAAGGCILIRPAALEGAGGVEASHNEVIDDCALAARVKRNGGRLWLGASATTASVRPYRGLLGIGSMISRTAFNQLRHSLLLLLMSLAGMLATYLLPPALLLFSHRAAPAALGGAAWLLMVISFLPILRVYRLSALWGLALPLIATFYMGATVHSAVKYWSGRGGEWKGRVQDPARDQG